jgi:hypothetical protein
MHCRRDKDGNTGQYRVDEVKHWCNKHEREF